MRSFPIPLVVIIFLLAYACSLAISVPALNINDEWITVNQLHQLGSGHQVITNEGKYGTFLSGNETPYFLERHNVLGYSLALPIISLPALSLFIHLGTIFRFFVIISVSLSLILCAVLIMQYYPQVSTIRGIRWPWAFVISAFGLLITNLLFFYPFQAQEPYPVEVAAVVFTEHILFGILAVVLFLICRTIFEDDWFSLSGSIALISCSSFLYWATNAKDHLLAAVVFSAIILCYLIYLRTERGRDAFFAFFCTGMLIWVRPELGITTGGSLLLFTLGDHLFNGLRAGTTLIHTFIMSLCGGITGSLPFFINNWLITGNPIKPIFLIYQEDFTGEAEMAGMTQTSGTLETFISEESVNPVFTLLSYYSPQWETFSQDLVLIFCSPESGMMGIFGMCPLLLVALAIIPIIWFSGEDLLKNYHKRTIMLMAVLLITVLLAYVRNFPGLPVSEGIGPDMRYLMPLYIPAGLLGLSGIYATLVNCDWRRFFRVFILFCTILPPSFILLLLIIQPLGGGFIEYTYTLSVCGTVATLCVLFSLAYAVAWKRNHPFPPFYIALMCSFPLSWQIMVVFLFSITKFNGYPFWLPVFEWIFSYFIIPVG